MNRHYATILDMVAACPVLVALIAKTAIDRLSVLPLSNLQFGTFHSLRTRDRADLLLARMAENRPYMLGTRGAMLAWL